MEVAIEIRDAEELVILNEMMTKLWALREEQFKKWQAEVSASDVVSLETADAPKKSSRKAKAAEPVILVEEPEVIKQPSGKKPEPVVIDVEPTYSTDHVREAVVDLSAALGSDAARSLLLEFGARKASEVPVEKIGEFVKAAKAKINDRAHTLVD
jgi:hypothetical protein